MLPKMRSKKKKTRHPKVLEFVSFCFAFRLGFLLKLNSVNRGTATETTTHRQNRQTHDYLEIKFTSKTQKRDRNTTTDDDV